MDVFEYFGRVHAAEEALGREISALVKEHADKLAAETGIAVLGADVKSEISAHTDRALPVQRIDHVLLGIKVNFKMQLG